MSESSLMRESHVASQHEVIDANLLSQWSWLMDLQPPVSGWVPLSNVDYPGVWSSVAFLGGCTWRCGYCHNKHLWDRESNVSRFESWAKFLSRRRGLIDAIVLSGGEPTGFKKLPELASGLRQYWRVGLHSGGADAKIFGASLKTVDWVGFDLKTSWDNYSRLTQNETSGTQASASFDLLAESGLNFEVRSTIWPLHHDIFILREMLHEIHRRGGKAWYLQESRTSSRSVWPGLREEVLNMTNCRSLVEWAEPMGIRIRRRRSDGLEEDLAINSGCSAENRSLSER